jgi:hypothetical protein
MSSAVDDVKQVSHPVGGASPRIVWGNFVSGTGLSVFFSGTGITVNSTTFVSSSQLTARLRSDRAVVVRERDGAVGGGRVADERQGDLPVVLALTL